MITSCLRVRTGLGMSNAHETGSMQILWCYYCWAKSYISPGCIRKMTRNFERPGIAFLSFIDYEISLRLGEDIPSVSFTKAMIDSCNFLTPSWWDSNRMPVQKHCTCRHQAECAWHKNHMLKTEKIKDHRKREVASMNNQLVSCMSQEYTCMHHLLNFKLALLRIGSERTIGQGFSPSVAPTANSTRQSPAVGDSSHSCELSVAWLRRQAARLPSPSPKTSILLVLGSFRRSPIGTSADPSYKPHTLNSCASMAQALPNKPDRTSWRASEAHLMPSKKRKTL